MKTPTTFTLPLRATRRILACAVVLEDARRVPVAYLRGGRPEEEMEYLAKAGSFHAALLEGLEKAAASLAFLAEETRQVGLEGYAIYAHGAKEKVELLLAQAKGVSP